MDEVMSMEQIFNYCNGNDYDLTVNEATNAVALDTLDKQIKYLNGIINEKFKTDNNIKELEIRLNKLNKLK